MGERTGRIVSGLLDHPGKVDRIPVDSRRRSRLEAEHAEAQLLQALRQSTRGRLAHASARDRSIPDVHQTVQERAGRHNHRVAFDLAPVLERDAVKSSLARQEPGDLRLEQD